MNTISLLNIIIWLSLSACATVGGNHQVIPIDSTPRGLDVYVSGEAKPIGSTPFFYNMQRVPHEEFTFRSAESGHEKARRLDCEFRWGTVLGGNGILAFFSPAAALSGIATDFVTGAAYDCSPGISVSLDELKRETKWVSYCRRFIVLPPQHFDGKTSDTIARLWQNANLQNLGGCDQFVSLQSTEDLFQYLNIFHSERQKAESLARFRLNLIGFRTSGTHLIQLDYKLDNGVLEFNPVTYDIFTLQAEKTPVFPPQNIQAPENLRFTKTEAAFFRSLALFPNSVTYGSQQGEFAIQETANNHAAAVKNPGVFRKYFDQISLTSTSHPMGFENWDYALSTFPSLQLYFGDYKIETAGQEAANLSFESIIPLYGVSLAIFTPLGTFSINGSLGPALLHQSYEKEEIPKYQASIASQFGVSYTAFFTANLFGQLGVNEMTLQRHLTGSADFSYLKSNKGAFFRIGYFVPWIKTDIRSLFSL